jgi:hypothetical protein
MSRPLFTALAKPSGWTPAQLPGIAIWAQPDIGGPTGKTTLRDVTNSSTRMRIVRDRLGNDLQVCRALDDAANGQPFFYGRNLGAGSVFSKRPCMGFDGIGVVVEICNAAKTSGITATDWTFGFRVTPDVLAGWLAGFSFGSAHNGNGIGIRSDGVYLYDGAVQKTPESYTAGDQVAVVVTKSGDDIWVDTKNSRYHFTVDGSKFVLDGTNTSMLLGAAGNALGGFFEGSYDELAFATLPASAADAALFLAYLRDPSHVPLLSAGTALLIGFGNSNQAGIGASESFIATLAAALSMPTATINLGVQGQTTAQMVSAFATGGKPYFTDDAASGSKTFPVFLEIENDLEATQVAATSLANVAAWAALVLAISPRLYTCNCLPMVGEGSQARYAGFEADRLSISASMVASPTTYGTHVVPVATDPSIGTAPNIAGNTWYLVEGVSPNRHTWHLTDPGLGVAVGLVKVPLALDGLT